VRDVAELVVDHIAHQGIGLFGAGHLACMFVNVFGVADSGDILVRHSRDGVHTLTFTQGEWAAFVGGVKAGQFDHA